MCFWKLLFQNKHLWNLCLSQEPKTHFAFSGWRQGWTGIDELVEEQHFVSCSASGPILKEILQLCLKKHNCAVDDLVISEMVTELCQSNPISLALGSNGPLSSSNKRRQYFKEHFSVVEPVEYLLSAKDQRTFQYIPILKSLHVVLKKKEIQDLLTHSCETHSSSEIKSFHDGTYFKANTLLT